jgi:glutamyl-tRNA synthetase
MNWTDPKTNELTEGFKEKGFLPEAFINLLALLGWNDGTEKEIFSKEEIIAAFSIERVHAAGAKFDYEKAKWFNHEWIKHTDSNLLLPLVKDLLLQNEIPVNNESLLLQVISLIKDRCTLLPDFVQQAGFFFKAPQQLDITAVKPKWTDEKKTFFEAFKETVLQQADFTPAALETAFKELATAKNIKPGELQLPLRIMLVGGKFGPPVFDIAVLLGKEEAAERIKEGLKQF